MQVHAEEFSVDCENSEFVMRFFYFLEGAIASRMIDMSMMGLMKHIVGKAQVLQRSLTIALLYSSVE